MAVRYDFAVESGSCIVYSVMVTTVFTIFHCFRVVIMPRISYCDDVWLWDGIVLRSTLRNGVIE